MTDITLRPGEFTLSIGIDKRYVLTYDCTGRPLTAFLDKKTYKRGLDNRILSVWRTRKGGVRVKKRRFLETSEAQDFLLRIHELTTTVSEKFEVGDTEVIQPAKGKSYPPEHIQNWLDQIVSLQPSTLEEDGNRFQVVYRPVGILPPDQYLSIVLQGTEGCSHNRCTFCNFYRDTEFRIKTSQEFSQHIGTVKGFLGRAMGLRKAIFLADANAMVIPRHQLVPMMEMIVKEFQLQSMGNGTITISSGDTFSRNFQGINSFIDSFSGPMKEVWDFIELKELYLRRLYLGLESGNDDLLRFLGKPGTSRDALTLTRRIKKAGIAVGMIVMAGIGGDRFAGNHVEDTVAVIKAMQLGKGDILYISDFLPYPDSEYVERAAAKGIKDLEDEEITAQRKAIMDSLLPEAKSAGFKIAPYNIQDFIY
jgi:radical SAM superfamily enzyme YgiQ (UPF0313 family)